MISYWGEDIAYDELGNPLNWINGETLTWQNSRQLASVDGVTYGYNADGLRVSKAWALGSTEYYVVDGQYIGEKTVKNGTQYFITYTYDENGSPAGINVNGTQYWFVKNLQGDVTAILDSSGAVVANYRYDAYGYIISITNGSGVNVGLTDTGHIARLNPFRYRGYMYDEETEFYYLRSRYYDPYIGRFLNADTQLNTSAGLLGYNLFAYCNNNPVNLTDSDGHIPFFAITAAIGAVVGAIIGGVKAAKSGKSVWKGALKGAAIGGLIGLGAGAAAGVVFASSATASLASVAIGVKALVATVGSAGITAGAKMIADNVSQASNSVPQVFWSGGDSAKIAAKQVAADIGGKTLDMTHLGTYLDQSDAPYSAWQAASLNFANVANNVNPSIYSIQNESGVGLQSIWRTIEYPVLEGKNIIYGVVTQNGTIQIMH